MDDLGRLNLDLSQARANAQQFRIDRREVDATAMDEVVAQLEAEWDAHTDGRPSFVAVHPTCFGMGPSDDNQLLDGVRGDNPIECLASPETLLQHRKMMRDSTTKISAHGVQQPATMVGLADCSICFERLDRNHPQELPCGHVFCGSCLGN